MSWKLLRSRVTELAKSVASPLKALIIVVQDTVDLMQIAVAMIRFFVSIAARSGSVKSIDKSSWAPDYREWLWSHVTWYGTRCILVDSNVNDTRIIPTRLIPDETYFPVSKGWLDALILDPMNKTRERRLGYTLAHASNTNRRATYTGHTFRRSYAVYVRCYLHQLGYHVSTKRPQLHPDVYTRACEGAGWSPTLTEFWEYSEDYQTYLGYQNLVDQDVLHWIVSGKRRGIDC